ncbi:MAG: hypothetical protein Q9214_004327, partial [Letrouitia sp. 1 TL-2023]
PNTKTSTTVLDFAKDLLYDLKYAQNENKEALSIGSVPIVFLVHSIGGLIVKEVSIPVSLQMVLEKDSSVLGYPGEISKALDADHNGVCKFDSPDDPLYINVRNVLKSLVSSFPSPGSSSSAVRSKHEDLREIEVFLRVSETLEADYIFFRDRWLPETCSWVLNDAVFNDWMHDISGRARVL